MRKHAILLIMLVMLVTGCNTENTSSDGESAPIRESVTDRSSSEHTDINSDAPVSASELTTEIKQLEKGLSAVKYEGDCGFEEFLANGGASSDEDVVEYLTGALSEAGGLSFGKMPFGCSTISVRDDNGNLLFGRNFDWDNCNALIVHSVPKNGYSSISTVNTDFINMSGMKLSALPDSAQAMIAMYAPLDGMNEKGLAVSVNMIQDSATISQNTDKPDITTTTAIRLLLNKAADVDEALKLLEQYDMHASMGFMTHLAIADVDGKSIVVEYINNEMQIVETPVVTNFYLAEGEKHGIGTAQSHERYDILLKALDEKPIMSMEEVRDALGSVSKGNFGEFESTEWSIVFNQGTGEVHYYHRENYDKRYTFSIKRGME
ncbi:MAG: linear amide C-N hydrolase [Oscillospiraceae bacterium]|nr:linear amide C-N hydrolase [Oscillospiraceae bacterium]